MAVKESEPLEKVTVRLYEGDFNRLAELFPSVKPNVTLRKLVRAFIHKVEGDAPAKLPKAKVTI